MSAGLDLYLKLDSLDAFDAVLAGAALGAGASALVSADRAFADIPQLAHVVPDEAGFANLIGVR